MDDQTLPGILIHHCQETNGFAVTGTKGHKVVCPDVVPSLWPQPHTGAVSKPESTTLGLFGWYFESSPSPDAPPACGSLSIPPIAAWQTPAGTHTVHTDWPAEPPPSSGAPRRQPLLHCTVDRQRGPYVEPTSSGGVSGSRSGRQRWKDWASVVQRRRQPLKHCKRKRSTSLIASIAM